MTLDAALRDLRHADPRVRGEAAWALGQSADTDRAPALSALRAALKDDAGYVRYVAALCLAELQDREAFAALCDQVEDGHPLARQAAVIALGRIGEPRAAEALLRAMQDPSADVRFQAVASLAEVEGVRAAPTIREALLDHDPEVRASAAAALGDIGDRGSCDALAMLLGDEAADARFEAAHALARFGDARAAPALLTFIDDREHALAALEALTGLREERARQAADKLLGRLWAPTLVKVRAAGLLRALGEARGTEYLEKAARSRREPVRGLAREILASPP